MNPWARVGYIFVLLFAIYAGFRYGFRDIWLMIVIYIVIFAAAEIITYFKLRNK